MGKKLVKITYCLPFFWALTKQISSSRDWKIGKKLVNITYGLPIFWALTKQIFSSRDWKIGKTKTKYQLFLYFLGAPEANLLFQGLENN